MKKFISGLIVGMMITTSFTVFASEYDIVANPYKVIVNGVDHGALGYLIDSTTYLPLREMCELLGKDINFEDGEILITDSTEESITEDAVTDETSTESSQQKLSKQCTETTYNGLKAVEYNGNTYLLAEDIRDNYGYSTSMTEETFVFTKGDSSVVIHRDDKSDTIAYKYSGDYVHRTYINISLFE